MATTASAPAAFDAPHLSSYSSDATALNQFMNTDSDLPKHHGFQIPPDSDTQADASKSLVPDNTGQNPELLEGHEIDATSMDLAAPPLAWTGDMTEASVDMINGVQADLASYEAEAAAAPEDLENQPMQAYAKLQFDDGDFYVNTYAVELGRDMDAMRHERRRKRTQSRRKEQDNREESHAIVDTIAKARNETAMSASNVSEAGGIIGANVYSDDEDGVKFARKKKRKYLTSNDSSQSQSIAPANLHTHANDLSFTSHLFPDGQDLGASQEDVTTSHFNECQFVPIHPAAGHSMAGISRKHIRIEYSTEKACWELQVLGRNGCFVNGDYVQQNERIRLRHNGEVMIQGIRIVFKLPDNAIDDEDQQEPYNSDSQLSSLQSSPRTGQAIERDESELTSGDEASPSKKDPQRRVKLKLSLSKRQPSSGKAVPSEKKAGKQPAKAVTETSEKASREFPTDADIKESLEQEMAQMAPATTPFNETPGTSETPAVAPQDLPPGSILAGLAPEEIPQKRKGPGRPPKNGVMSKRDEAIIKRKKKEFQKAGKEIPPLAELLAMARAEGSTTKKEKEDGGPEDDVKPSIEAGSSTAVDGGAPAVADDSNVDPSLRQSQPSAENDANKVRRTAKSPSPQKPESEYTEEELKKPAKTYVVLIHEALSNCPSGVMDLQQIYDAIQKMFPYYKYRTPTQGWQSSIRHNLIGSDAFEEAGKIGKGRLWKINTSFPIDKEKKRRAPSPAPQERQQYPNTYYPNANGQYPYSNQGYSPYRPSPYGTPYGPPTTMPNGARPPPTAQRPPAYHSPYASNTGAQPHASPYGPPSRPPYAQSQPNQSSASQAGNQPQPNRPQANQAPHQPPNTQPPASQQNGQQIPQQSQQQAPNGGRPPNGPGQPPTPQPNQGQQQQQSSIGNEDTVEEIMAYHRQYIHKFSTNAEQDTARQLFRKAVNRHIHRGQDHGPFSNDEEKMISDQIGVIIARSNTRARAAQAAPHTPQPGNTPPVSQAPSPAQRPPVAIQNQHPTQGGQITGQGATAVAQGPPATGAAAPNASRPQRSDGVPVSAHAQAAMPHQNQVAPTAHMVTNRQGPVQDKLVQALSGPGAPATAPNAGGYSHPHAHAAGQTRPQPAMSNTGTATNPISLDHNEAVPASKSAPAGQQSTQALASAATTNPQTVQNGVAATSQPVPTTVPPAASPQGGQTAQVPQQAPQVLQTTQAQAPAPAAAAAPLQTQATLPAAPQQTQATQQPQAPKRPLDTGSEESEAKRVKEE
ncbi:hypothetical protein MBLNU457_4090t1 [Dothideomycetes sp. NU457]